MVTFNLVLQRENRWLPQESQIRQCDRSFLLPAKEQVPRLGANGVESKDLEVVGSLNGLMSHASGDNNRVALADFDQFAKAMTTQPQGSQTLIDDQRLVRS